MNKIFVFLHLCHSQEGYFFLFSSLTLLSPILFLVLHQAAFFQFRSLTFRIAAWNSFYLLTAQRRSVWEVVEGDVCWWWWRPPNRVCSEKRSQGLYCINPSQRRASSAFYFPQLSGLLIISSLMFDMDAVNTRWWQFYLFIILSNCSVWYCQVVNVPWLIVHLFQSVVPRWHIRDAFGYFWKCNNQWARNSCYHRYSSWK